MQQQSIARFFASARAPARPQGLPSSSEPVRPVGPPSSSEPVRPVGPPLSSEQARIVAASLEANVIVDAVAGSGKTTTLLSIVAARPEAQFLLLTYNARLRRETSERTRNLGLGNVQVHTYHSFVTMALGETVRNDIELNRAIERPWRARRVDVLIVDECQDMTTLLYKVVCRVRRDCMDERARIVLLGDVRQCIFDFNGASPLFLGEGERCFHRLFCGEWRVLTLHESFRCPSSVCKVANCFMQTELLRPATDKPGQTELYVSNQFDMGIVIGRMFSILAQWRHQDVFVLAPSLKNKHSPARRFANALTIRQIPIYVPMSEEESLREESMEGKVVFSTFHQVKGLERPVTFVFGIDDGYFQMFGRGMDSRVCPSVFYVALTRATHTLILVQHEENDFCRFTPREELERAFDIVSVSERFFPVRRQREQQTKTLAVTDLVRFVPWQALDKIQRMFSVTVLREGGQALRYEATVMGEDVSDITGTAAVCAFERQRVGTLRIEAHCRQIIKEAEEVPRHYALDVVRSSYFQVMLAGLMRDRMPPVEALLRWSVLLNALASGYMFKLAQIRRFDWLSQGFLDACVQRLSAIVDKESCQFEMGVRLESDAFLLIGQADVVNPHSLYEIKCVQETKLEHQLQLIVYEYMMRARGDEPRRLFLYNVLRDELVEVHVEMSAMVSIVGELVRLKMSRPATVGGDDFFALIEDAQRRIMGV